MPMPMKRDRVRGFLEQEQFERLMVSDVKPSQEAILPKVIQRSGKLMETLRGGAQCTLMRSLVNEVIGSTPHRGVNTSLSEAA